MSADQRRPDGAESVVELRRTVHEQLARAEQLIAALTRDLEAERARVRTLTGERDRLLVALATSDATRVQLEEHKARLERTLVDLDRERRRLADARDQLSEALESERHAAALEVDCLEEQIAELSAMVELLASAETPSG